jgi:hypothetical protein
MNLFFFVRQNLHALLDVSPTSVERLNRCQIYPVVIYLKFKSTKQIKFVFLSISFSDQLIN